jgi:hypothetical protein
MAYALLWNDLLKIKNNHPQEDRMDTNNFNKMPSDELKKTTIKKENFEATTDQKFLKECIESCLECYRSCLSLIPHCLEMGAKHASKKHIGLLQSCAAICETSAAFMSLKSEFQSEIAKLCSEVCIKCAESCEELVDNDKAMSDCAEVCRKCATSCDEIIAHTSKSH